MMAIGLAVPAEAQRGGGRGAPPDEATQALEKKEW